MYCIKLNFFFSEISKGNNTWNWVNFPTFTCSIDSHNWRRRYDACSCQHGERNISSARVYVMMCQWRPRKINAFADVINGLVRQGEWRQVLIISGR